MNVGSESTAIELDACDRGEKFSVGLGVLWWRDDCCRMFVTEGPITGWLCIEFLVLDMIGSGC